MAVAYAFYQMRADGTPALLDDPEYHAEVRRGAVPLTHVFGPLGAVALKAASAPPVPLTGKRKKQHPGAAESDSE
jgi:hypothetical protein